MNYLRTSSEIRESIADLFAGPELKWAIVGFVGYGALDQLPADIENLSVICWPKAGATHPDGVRRLIQAGVEVFFCDRLHSKIYWASNRGLIVGSANLSRNALASNQHEFAVYIEGGAFDITQVLSRLKYKKVSDASLAALDVAHVAVHTREPDLDDEQQPASTFVESRRMAMPRHWKLVAWSERRVNSTTLRNVVSEQTGTATWINDNDVEREVYQAGDFVLQVQVDENGRMQRANCKWLRVDLVAKLETGLAIVQLKPLAEGPPPPFAIDSKFKKSLKFLLNESAWKDVIDASATVKRGFIKKLQALCEDDKSSS